MTQCILAPNVCRVTIMNRDMSSLAMLRHRYENFIHHPTSVDKKMRDILLVLPTAPNSQIKIEEVRPKDVHGRNTRLNEEHVEALKTQQGSQNHQVEKLKKLELLGREHEVLKQLQLKIGDFQICYKDGGICDLLQMDLQMLRNVDVDISNRAIFACLW